MENEESKLKIIWELFSLFFGIGMFTFGGGYTMIALIEDDIVNKKKWSDEKEFLDIIAISESTPGPVSVNSATFIGYKAGGFWGSVAATLGVVLPSFIIITIISFFLSQFSENVYVQKAFAGIRAGSVVLFVEALRRLSKKLDKNKFTISVMVVGFCLVAFLKFSAFVALALAAIAGIIYNVILAKEAKK